METEKYDFYDERRCPKCGNRFVLALLGEKKIDNTIYKITFDGSSFDVDDIVQKIKNWEEGNVIYEGDTLHKYLLMDILNIPELCYIVTPEFSYKRSMAPHIALCPDCGNETIEKKEETDGTKDYIKNGRFCEYCNKWTVWFCVSET